MNDLINQITSQLNVDESQAKGGVGMLIKFAKEHLGGDDAAEMKDAIPDADALEAEAPDLDGDSGGGGVMGMLGDVAGALGGEKAGAMAGLAGGLGKLGFDLGDIARFVPIVTGFLSGQGKGGLAQKLQGLLGGE